MAINCSSLFAEATLGTPKAGHYFTVKQGNFPATFDIGKERFGFVSLDVDLYAPTKSGLEIFFPLMIDRGVLLVHDYYNDQLPGVKQAVDEFIAYNSAGLFPIGDAMSVAVIKQVTNVPDA
jgi:hypothetical protein